jgi:glycine hydroxymethyltransferase
MKKVLFICTGNVCRSPMAEGLLRHLAGDEVEVASAGLGAGRGQPPSAHAIDVLRGEGIDISDIRSQPVSADLLREADYIFTMTRDHLDMLLLLFPEMASKARLLRFDDAAKGGRPDVTDPIGGTRGTYEACKEDIKRAMPRVIKLITGQTSPMNTATRPGLTHEPSDIAAIEASDPAIAAAIHDEERRQFENIELIASENFTSRAVR